MKRKTSAPKPMPSPEYLRECFEYKNGKLIWKYRPGRHFPGSDQRTVNSWNARRVGKESGSMHEKYHFTFINRVRYITHRLIYHMIVGPIPVNQFIDHIDRDRSNNRIENLRVCSMAENTMNRRRSLRKNKNLPKHVVWNKARQCYRVTMMAHKNSHYIGSFKVLEDAIQAAQAARIRLHGQFACDAAQ